MKISELNGPGGDPLIQAQRALGLRHHHHPNLSVLLFLPAVGSLDWNKLAAGVLSLIFS